MKKVMIAVALALTLAFAGCASTVQYKVTFYVDGEEYYTATVDDGSPLRRPTDPVRDGYEFDGWYVSADGMGEMYDFGKKVTSSFSLYAGWKTPGVTYTAIRTADEFVAMERDKSYRLVADIDLSGKTLTAMDIPYSGEFDGAGYSITGYKQAQGGLFGTVTGAVKNLRVTGASVSRDVQSGTIYAGIIADRLNGGTVQNCAVNGSITVKSADDRLSVYAGLIAGRSYSGRIEKCVADGNIEVNNVATAYAGGIVAYNGGEGEVRSHVLNCRFGGDITAISGSETGSAYVGGIVGYNAGEIAGSFGSGGKLTGMTTHYYDFVGGVAGDNNGGSVYDCLGMHDIKATTWHGNTFVGGVVGHNFLDHTVDNCFVWDGQRIELDVTDGEYYRLARHKRVESEAVSAERISSESFQRELFSLFDIKAGYFPALPSEDHRAVALTPVSGTRGMPIEISTADELASMDMFKSYKLTADITVEGGFTPIGTYEHPFYGSLDGDGHTVGIAPSGEGVHALFGYFSGNVQDLKVSASYTGGSDRGVEYVAAVVAYNTGGRIYGCTAQVDFEVTANGAVVGGVVAYNDGGTVERCDSLGEIYMTAKTQSAVLGGTAGINYDGKIAYCVGEISLSATGDKYLSVGGTAGKNDGDIRYCLNTGDIAAILRTDGESSVAALGGIVGSHDGGDVVGCFAINSVGGNASNALFVSGGIAGINRAAIRECCYLCDDVKYGAGYSKNEISVATVKNASELEQIVNGMGGDVWIFDKDNGLPVLKGREAV